MKIVGELVKVFLVYVIINILYLTLLNTNIASEIDYLMWNQISKIFRVLINILFIFFSLIIIRNSKETIMTMNLTRLITATLYLSTLYFIVISQLFMMKVA